MCRHTVVCNKRRQEPLRAKEQKRSTKFKDPLSFVTSVAKKFLVRTLYILQKFLQGPASPILQLNSSESQYGVFGKPIFLFDSVKQDLEVF